MKKIIAIIPILLLSCSGPNKYIDDICDGIDNNNDGLVDINYKYNGSACGSVLNKPCKYEKDLTIGLSCYSSTCECRINSQKQILVCSGENNNNQKWQLLENIKKLCASLEDLYSYKSYYCGQEKLRCDVCDGGTLLFIGKSCVSRFEYTQPPPI